MVTPAIPTTRPCRDGHARDPTSRAGDEPAAGEPFKVGLCGLPRALLAAEQRIGLGEHEGEGPALAPGEVRDGEFRTVDPAVDVFPALLGERPLEGPPPRFREECHEGGAQLAPAAARWQF